jgi:hypothetical protein
LDVAGLNVQFTVNCSSPSSNVPLALASWNSLMVAEVKAMSVMSSLHCGFAAGALAGLAAIGAFVGIRYSRSVGRTHNKERDACLVIFSVAVFLLAWVALALLVAQTMPTIHAPGGGLGGSDARTVGRRG